RPGGRRPAAAHEPHPGRAGRGVAGARRRAPRARGAGGRRRRGGPRAPRVAHGRRRRGPGRGRVSAHPEGMPGRVLVVVPTYDEALTLPGTLARLRVAVPDADVLVVDDASP